MKKAVILSGVVGYLVSVLGLCVLNLGVVRAVDATEPALIVSAYKVTASNGQFVELHNNGAEPLDMSGIQLAYYNHYDISKATSSKLIALSGSLAPGAYYLVQDGASTLCYQTMVSSASLSFSSTAGMVQVHRLAQDNLGGPISSMVLDVFSWSRTAVSGIQTLPAQTNSFLKRTWQANQPKTTGGGSWTAVQPSLTDPCQLESALPVTQQTVSYTFAPGALPPVRYVAAPTDPKLINRNAGKQAPMINEVLANPASPLTDADDEFVELYNPNDTAFDLTNFAIAFGSTNPKTYKFPDDTLLPAKSFVAFTSADTSISLSNSGAQVWLLDPGGHPISQSQPYVDAPDGEAWALDNGTWRWTAVPTPNESNAFSLPAEPNSAAQVLGISTTSSPVSNVAQQSSTSSTQPGTRDDAAPLHPAVLAGIGVLAVAYGVYEYRHDMANRIFQFRRYLRHRRALRQTL